MIVHVFIEKCSFLVDRLGCTSEFYIEVEQKGGGGASGYAPVHYGSFNMGYSIISLSQRRFMLYG